MIQGVIVSNSSTKEVWRKLLSGGDVAVVLLNLGDAPASITALWADVGLPPHLPVDVRDLWLRKDVAFGVRELVQRISTLDTNNFLTDVLSDWRHGQLGKFLSEENKVEINSSLIDDRDGHFTVKDVPSHGSAFLRLSPAAGKANFITAAPH